MSIFFYPLGNKITYLQVSERLFTTILDLRQLFTCLPLHLINILDYSLYRLLLLEFLLCYPFTNIIFASAYHQKLGEQVSSVGVRVYRKVGSLSWK